MRRSLFPLVLVCLFFALPVFSQRVIEGESKIAFGESSAEVALVAESMAAPATVPIRVELLDENDRIVGKADGNIRLKRGKGSYKLTFPSGEILKNAGETLAWYRVRYELGGSSGIVSLSQFLADDFELRVAAAERVVPGEIYVARVRALNPLSDRPVKSVAISGTLEIEIDTEADEDELSLNASGRTNGDGYVELRFKVPDNIKVDDIDLVIRGVKGGLVRELDENLDDESATATVLLTADKPLYQPGQSFSVRGLFLDANHVVIAGKELEFSIEDGDDTLLYRQKVVTSAFGIAAVSWRIPDNAKLGEYKVIVDSDDEELEADQLLFKVSRYDLPNFAVGVKPDKTFYLPDDNLAEFAVFADYLFGKPVPKGKVRVVRQSERKWDWNNQKWEVKEGDSVEGEADADGKFRARFNIKPEMNELLSRSWRKYDDIDYAAYVTDPSTNRTEQKRFRIRLTKESIHIYTILYDRQHRGLPTQLYFTTFYADGTPASCEIVVSAASGRANGTVAKVKTNSLGAGKLVYENPSEQTSDSELKLAVLARDKRGASGTADVDYYFREKDVLQLNTVKTILKPGDPIDISLKSTREKGVLYVDVVKDDAILESRLVDIRNGKANLLLPYRAEFRGELTIAAYTDEQTYRWDSNMRASRGVIYPEEVGLNLKAKFSNATYKPGENARVSFSVLDGRGSPAESALGIVVFDKAVEQRARTDEDFGGYFSVFSRYIGYGKYLGDINVRDLNKLDTSKPISPEMELAAEIMLAGNYYYPDIYREGGNSTSAASAYSEFFKAQLDPLKTIITTHFDSTGEFPSDEASLRRVLMANGKDVSRVKDPWGNEYYFNFSTNRSSAIDTFRTAGPDKIRGNDDDFEVLQVSVLYFNPIGNRIDSAISEYVRNTGSYVRDIVTFRSVLNAKGIDPDLKDRWGRDYLIHFESAGRNYLIRIESKGPNGEFDSNGWRVDDFDIWKSYTDYFHQTEANINRILNEQVNGGKRPFPTNDADFAALLKSGGLDLTTVLDGGGRPVVLRSAISTRYADRLGYVDGKQVIKPVTEQLKIFTLHMNATSPSDQVEIARFSSVMTEAFAALKDSSAQVRSLAYTGTHGAISGVVSDSTGAVIPGARVTATKEGSTENHQATSDASGAFLIANIPSGRYSLRVDANNFKSMVMTGLEVRPQNMLEMNVRLEVGGVSEVVTVTSDAHALETSNSSMVSNTLSKSVSGIKIGGPGATEMSTPRLREFFPETLYWQPELITDKKGKAEATFKMADNITTWKMYTIASTKKGKIGVAENEVTAFQSFFVDLDPPKFLTTGDEIFLPTQVRNYTDKRQNVNVTMANADWFEFLGCNGTRTPSSARQQVTAKGGNPTGREGVDGGRIIPASYDAPAASCDSSGMKRTTAVDSGQSENTIFGFKAVRPAKEGKQRVTAIAQGDSDAIERPVTVRPDGQEIVHTESRYFAGTGAFALNFPANAMPSTHAAELKIYPNLMAHVAESVDGLLRRPYGCGEQTISSTYPNLMILKFAGGTRTPSSASGGDSAPRRISEATERKAKKFLQSGYERLLGYQSADGGFSYWGGKETADFALTAYALRFLADANGFVDVDPEVVKKAQDWLIRQQRTDGSWNRTYSWETTEDNKRAKATTTYVARTLAKLSVPPAVAGGSTESPVKTSLTKALTYLRSRNAEIDDPYSLALFGLAAHDAGDMETARLIRDKLRTLALDESGAAYWNLESNTAFNGWGYAGRIETTALVTQLTLKLDPKDELVGRAMIFLLKNKDRYGVWYSTQTTINVLDTFIASMAASGATGTQTVDVMVNGAKLQTIEIGPDKLDQIILDLNGKIAGGNNQVELRSSDRSPLMAQVVANHYIDWRDADVSGRQVNESRALRLDYKCDRTSAAIMNEISCSVEAERIGYRGYGMLLAEIGTPPGADVNRESLQAAMDADWSISRYDILPDRIVVYMWSKPGGTKLNFRFKPRYAINAKTPASTVYDYYNPEANAVVAPLSFAVR